MKIKLEFISFINKINNITVFQACNTLQKQLGTVKYVMLIHTIVIDIFSV